MKASKIAEQNATAKQSSNQTSTKISSSQAKNLSQNSNSQSENSITSSSKSKISINSSQNSSSQSQNSSLQSKESSKNSINSTQNSKNSTQKTQNSNTQNKESSKNSTNSTQNSKNSARKNKMTPKFLARQEKIKKVALSLFLTKGYDETSLKDIIKKSGGSFSDIYATFENKQSLFISVCNDMLKANREIYGKLLEKKLPLREFLYEFSTQLMSLFLKKRAMGLARIMYSQLYNKSNQDLIEHFKQNRENVPSQTIVQYFRGCEPPLCDEAQRYAELFFTLLKGKCMEEMFFYGRAVMSKKEQEEHCKFVVDFFVKGLA